MTRAWVYQERLLAPRILYFDEELSWECREASACECSEASHGMKYDHSLSLMPGYSTGKLYLQWQEMVEEFTWLQLSHEEDRLPAFSGLAQQYQYRLRSEYLAGLWKENLGADLLWFAYPEHGSEAQRYYTKKPKSGAPLLGLGHRLRARYYSRKVIISQKQKQVQRVSPVGLTSSLLNAHHPLLT